MRLFNNRQVLQPPKSWKSQTNRVIVAKNIMNSPMTNNSTSYKAWPATCEMRAKYKFNANPIRHYRKQYTGANSFSNNSLIGTMDKPGNYIVTTDTECVNSDSQNMHIHILNNTDGTPLSNDWTYDKSLNRMVCTACNPQSLVMKPARTVLDNNYCSSNREYLYKKCKTYDQNLPTNNDINVNNGTMSSCNASGCKTTFNPSNKRYQTQGPVSASTRLSALKYNTANNFKNPTQVQLYQANEVRKTKLEECCLNTKKSSRTRINILS